jgi:hypothetical protein
MQKYVNFQDDNMNMDLEETNLDMHESIWEFNNNHNYVW